MTADYADSELAVVVAAVVLYLCLMALVQLMKMVLIWLLVNFIRIN